MDPVTLKKRQNAINLAIRRATKHESHHPFLDGIACPEEYCRAKYRILFIAKEPHVPDDEIDDGLEYLGSARNDCANKTLRPSKNKYMDPLKCIAYGILNGFVKWDDMPDPDKDAGVFRACCKTGQINLRKLPGPPRSDMRRLSTGFKEFKDIVLQQIDIADPDIVVCLGTIGIIGPEIVPNTAKYRLSGHAKTFDAGKRVIIAAYHPVQSTISRKNYCDDVIGAAKKHYSGR